MTRPRAADDYATIRARLEELRRERDGGGTDDGGRSGEPEPRRGDGDSERRRRARMEGLPPPWVPTIFVKKPRA